MMRKKLLCTCLLAAGVMLTACQSQTENVSTQTLSEASVSIDTTTDAVNETSKDYSELIKSYIDAIDTQYGYELAHKLAYDETLGGECGFRTAGSDYEHLTADLLAAEMENIGLTDIEKIPVTVDRWQFDYASLTIEGTDIDIVPASYAQTGTDEAGITTEIVNLGDGFAADYEGIDVEGKIVLIAVDQRNVEWIDSYIQEASLNGAAAVVSYSVGGYAMYSDDDRNIQDVCCDDILPTVSISRNEANAIIEAIETGNNQCTLKVYNTVEDNVGTSYTVVGKIKGKSGEQQMIYSAHYDKYFYGFQDDCCAISLIFTIAKAMNEVGYVPENDILVVCHGAEEWGAIDCQHDWTTGAWETINTVHPEWAKKTIAMFNFELPGFLEEGQTSGFVATVPEYADYVEKFVDAYDASIDNGTFSEGIRKAAVAVSTMEDGVSYRFAGVPYFLNGVDFTDEESFAGMKYHTESDCEDTWNEGVFAQNAALYGALGIVTDMNPAMELNLSASIDWLLETLDDERAAEAGVDVMPLRDGAAKAKEVTSGIYKEACSINEQYLEAYVAGDEDTMRQLRAKAVDLNAKSLEIFKLIQDELIGLESSANVVIRHEGYKNTLDLLEATIEACNEGKIVTDEEDGALDIVWAINSGYAYSSYMFSSENVATTTAIYSRGDDNMYWGTNKVTEFAEVDEAIKALIAQDMETALAGFEAAYDKALTGYKESIEKEILGVQRIYE